MGRPSGAPNKTSTKLRAAFNRLLENNSDNIAGWLEKVAAEDPKEAYSLILKTAEFTIPKLARVENKTNVSGSLNLVVANPNDEDI